ncbi:hypothetical protein NDI45_10070 [Leptolyngbya sp. GB1-A1]|uniref:hypothetical protein n=1 Tax=Leptolyngbya sp. GB1-A1 TaxID=2933908 RepID=UPI0032971D0C
MQLQVECGFPGLAQPCSLCEQSFEMKEGRVILCDDQGDRYGEVCPDCISQGIHWLNHEFERLVQQLTLSHCIKSRHPYRLEESKSVNSPISSSVSSDRRHDPSPVRSKTLHSTTF